MEAVEITEMKKNSNNKKFVLEQVARQGKLLEFADGNLQDDEEVVKTALEQDGEAMEFASDRLKDNKELMLLAIKSAPWTACYASDRLKSDKDVILASVETYGQTLYYASEELRDDEEVVKKAVSNKGIIVKYASLRLRDKKEIAEIAIKQNKTAYHYLSENMKKDEDIKVLLRIEKIKQNCRKAKILLIFIEILIKNGEKNMIIDVIDLKQKEINFTKQYTTKLFAKGKTIFHNGMVDIRTVQMDSNGEYTIYSKVGNYWNPHDVMININENMATKYGCDCQNYKKGEICEHIIATSFEILNPHRATTEEGEKRLIERRRKLIEEQRKEEDRRREYERKYHSALYALNMYKDNKSENMHKDITNTNELNSFYKETMENQLLSNDISTELATQIRIEPKGEYNDETSFYVSFKIGQTTLYSLKEISEFSSAFNREKQLTYGKKLTFIAKKDNFVKQDQKILDFIIKYGETVKYEKRATKLSYYGYYRASNLSDKAIMVFEDNMDEFFQLIKDRELEFVTRFGKAKYMYSENKPDIQVNLTKSKQKEYTIKCNINNYDYFIAYDNIYLFLNEKIYKINKKENKGIYLVLEIFNTEDEIKIPEDKFEDFSKYILSKMGKFLQNNLPKTTDSIEPIVLESLASKMYLDLDEDDNIKMELKFCYGEKEFNLLDKDSQKYIEENHIQRNAIEEKNVLAKIFRDGFELVDGRNYFVLKNLDKTYEFLAEKMENYMKEFEILVTEKFKNKEIRRPRISNVSVKLNNGLLELDLSKLDFDLNEVKDVLKNYNIKKKYFKLKNGDFLSLEPNDDLDFLNEISNGLDINYDKIDRGIVKLPVNRSIYLEKLLSKNANINKETDDEFNDLVSNVENKKTPKKISIDKSFEKVLRDYQKTGYKWLKVLENYKFGGILADDMGLGKTLQVIALLASSLNEKKKNPSIVVAPSSLVLNWHAEIEKWCPKINACIIKGDAKSRKDLINTCNDYDLVLTSYDLLKRDISEYEGIKFKYIIADEAQYIKNFATQNATALKALEGEIKFALTGTPIENSVAELWSIFDFIMPGYLYTYNKFKKKLQDPILKEEDSDALKRLKTLINPFILRRVKKDVLTELPEKNITIMKNEMTDEQQKLYMSYFVQTKKEIMEELNQNGFEKSKLKILMLLTRLRQICCHPSLFIENYNGESGKLNQCLDLINEAIQSGHKILLFSSYTSMFEIMEEKLKQSGIEYYKLTGSTPVNKRVQMVDEFNENKDIKIFLISLKAGGTGLNLTGADVVIHYDPWWNASIENQATDRAYRIGQKNSVQVYKLITNNTIEEKINKLQEKKAKLSEQLLSTEETFINKLSKEEIMALFE